MGQPLRVGDRAQKHSRVADKKAFAANFDSIDWKSKHAPSQRVGLTRMVWVDGKLVTVIENGKCVRPDIKLRPNHLKSGISVYDVLRQPNGPNSEPTQLRDISEAAKAGGNLPPLPSLPAGGPSPDAL